MTTLENQINYTLPRNIKFSKNSRFYWPGSLHEAVQFLTFICYYETLDSYFDTYNFSETLMNDLKRWDLENITKSALYFYFETRISLRKKDDTGIIVPYDWKILASLIINSKLSDNILSFIEELDLMSISSEKLVISGSLKAIENIIVFEAHITETDGLKKLLKFLKVDLPSIDSLVNEAFKEKKLDKIAAFLYTFESGLDKNLILTKYLINYKNFTTDKSQAEQKRKVLSEDFFQLEQEALESFDIFDMFDSSEEVKSKVSTLNFYSFHEKLFDDITNKPKGSSIKLFKLFEQYLYSLKDKRIFLKDLSIKRLTTLVKNFYLAYKQQVDEIIENDSNLFKEIQQKLPLETILFGLILLILSIFNIIGLAPKTRSQLFLRSNNFAMITYQAPKWSNYDERASSFQSIISQPASVSSLTSTRPLQSSNFKPVRAKVYNAIVSHQQQYPLQIQSKGSINLNFSQKQVQQKVTEINQLIVTKYPEAYIVLSCRNVLDSNNSLVTTNDITLIGSNASYRRGQLCKEDVARMVRESNGILTFTTRSQIDQDHGLIKPILEGFGIRRQDGSTLFLSNLEHRSQGLAMDYKVPKTIGYTAETGNVLDLLDIYEQRYVKILNDRYATGQTNFFTEDLKLSNITANVLENGARSSFSTDRQTLINKSIPDYLLLPLSHVKLANHYGASEFNRLADRFAECSNPSVKKIANTITHGLENSIKVRKHYLGVKPYLINGTLEGRDAKRAEQAFLHKVDEAISYAEAMGVSINPSLHKSFIEAGFVGHVSLDEAENIVRGDLLYDDLKGGVPLLFASNIRIEQ